MDLLIMLTHFVYYKVYRITFFERLLKCLEIRLTATIPLKQGLRLFLGVKFDFVDFDSYYSIKTRIKTEDTYSIR